MAEHPVPALLAAVCCAAALTPPASAQTNRAIRGRIVDTAGEPVAGVDVGTNWEFVDGRVTPWWRSENVSKRGASLRTDEAGRFAGTLYFRGRPVALIVVDREGGRGGTAIVTPDNVDSEVELVVGPLRRVRGVARIELPLLRDNTVRVYAFDPRAPIAMATAVLDGGGDYEFLLPPGPYKLSFVAAELKRVETMIELGAADLDVGATELAPTDLARLYGKPAPEWHVTAARGLELPVQVSDFAGRWVLLEYWSHT